MSTLQRYAGIYRIMWRNSLIREMNFKANFLLWMLVEMLWFFGQIVFINVLFGYVNTIGDWTKWEVVLLIGTHQIIGQIFQAFFYVNVANLPELIRTGRLDIMLLQPVDTQFAVCTRQFGLDNIVNVVVGVADRVVFAVPVAPDSLRGAGRVVSGGGGVWGGDPLFDDMFGLATMSFWIVRAQGLIHGYYNLFNIARYPRAVFSGIFRWIFSWIIPVLVVANVPAELLVRPFTQPWGALAHLAAAALLVLGLVRMFWLFALRRYASTSS
ncbi:MAG: ABC-2 family transporter protein [Chthoniobacteraceae bacterium]